MRPKVEIEGDSEEAVAFALLQMVAQAEGKLDGDGELKGVDRDWILDAYTECLAATYGMRADDGDDGDDDEDDEDDLEEDEDDLDDEEDEEEEGPATGGR
jgi:uncharacterized membrane protein YukC